MKKLLSLTLALVMLLGLSSVAFATDMGVQVISGPEEETEPENLDDLKLNVEANIEGWGILTLTSFDYSDELGCYEGNSWGGYYQSGAEADFAILRADITNSALKAKDYLADVHVKAVYDDIYEYNGWFYQSNFDMREHGAAISSNDQFAIDPMYQGHYIFGCTLPNAIVNGKKPLQMIITIDGNEITYNIRK